MDVFDFYRGKNILVTGGTGLIGREVVVQLAEAGARVTSVSLDDLPAPHPSAEQVKGDLSDLSLCRSLVAGRDGVFHLAGIKGSVEVTKSKPASFFVNLLMMNTNVLEACRQASVPKVLYSSSIGAYESAEVFVEQDGFEEGAPMDFYPGWAKRMAEFQVRAYRLQYGLENFAVVRPCNVYGPGDNFDPENGMVIPSLMAKVKSGTRPVLVWGDGSAVRDFAYSSDVADGCLRALFHGTGGRYVNLGSGKGYTIRELVETFQKVVPFDVKFDTEKPSGFPRRIMDISLARRTLGFEPRTSLREGLQRTWDWFMVHGDESRLRKNYFGGPAS